MQESAASAVTETLPVIGPEIALGAVQTLAPMSGFTGVNRKGHTWQEANWQVKEEHSVVYWEEYSTLTKPEPSAPY